MTTYITKAGDTVDYVTWKFYGYTNQKAVEQVLEANPGLADLGVILQPNVRIELPVLVKPANNTGLKLWD